MRLSDERLHRRLDVLRETDREAHAVFLEALPRLAEHVEHEGDVAFLIDLVAQVAAEAPDAATAFATRLEEIVMMVSDIAGIRKWVLHGLQRHRNDTARRVRYFTYDDPSVFTDARTENDAAYLLRRRDALLHYIAGFGVSNCAIELHEPQPASFVTPSVSVEDDVIRFPRRCGVTPGRRDTFYRAALAHLAAHKRYSPLAKPAGNRKPMLLTFIGLVEDARVERLMAQAYPGLRALWGGFHVANRESSGFQLAGLAARLARALHDPAYVDNNTWVDGGRHLFEEAAAINLHDVAAFEAVGRKLAIGMEKMRLPLSTDYRVEPSYRDDNALLWNFNETYLEDDREHVTQEEVEFRPREEVPPDVRQITVDTRRRTRHPEWDYRLEALREDWVTVIEPAHRPRTKSSATITAKLSVRVEGQRRIPDRAIHLKKLAEGDELDLNAAVENVIDLRAKGVPDGRIFRRHGRRRRSSAVVVLMDLSESTGRFVPGSFTTVMEVEKRAARLIATTLDREHDRVALHGFASNGRHEVHYHQFKDFDEPFGSEEEARLTQLQGSLSTRMGAALRHATMQLSKQTADHKVIVMLTDGEPSDVDVIEDDYLVEDARHAVVAAAAKGVQTFCLTLDRHADDYVRRIFGSRNYLIADRAATFAGYAGQTLVKLIAS